MRWGFSALTHFILIWVICDFSCSGQIECHFGCSLLSCLGQKLALPKVMITLMGVKKHKKSVFSFFLVKYACLICVNCQTMLCVSLWWCVYTRLFFANHAWSNAEAKQQELLQVYRHLLFLRNGCISFLLSFIFEFFPACIRYCKRNIVHLFHVIELRAALAFKKPPTKNIKSNSIPQTSALWKFWLQQRDLSKGLLLLVSSIVTAVRSLSPNAQWQRKETGVRQWGEAEWKPFLLGDSAALVFVCAAYQTSTSACIRACVCCPWVHSCQVESHSRSSQCWYFLLLIPPPLKCTVPLLGIWRHLFFFFFLQTVHIHCLFSLSPTKPVWHHFYCHTGASCDCNYTSYNPVAVCWSLLERR